MMKVTASNGPLTVVAYRGDAKTLIAIDLTAPAARKRLAGFTIRVKPPGKPAYYLWNRLQFKNPADHAQDPDPNEPARSSINAPFHKFRWVHVPGLEHQGLSPTMGDYVYTVTPRYFDANRHMLPIDPALSVEVAIEVRPFEKGKVKLGFTRGFTQSQAFVEHFGLKTKFKPKDADLRFDTSLVAGTNDAGESFTYAQLYEWSGWTARDRVFDILRAVKADPSLTLDLFAYDLNEPDVINLMLDIGNRARVILDNAGLHHSATKPKPEDEFETLFAAKAGASRIKRGKFSRYAHDKVIVVYKNAAPVRVLTGSTNLSVTGVYVNSNHVLVFEDAGVAGLYGQLFQQVWDQNVAAGPFKASALATSDHSFGPGTGLPDTTIAFSPHNEADARAGLMKIVNRAAAEANETDGLGSVLFAVMELQGADDNPVYDALSTLHANTNLFSFGISDNPEGINLYRVGEADGVLVTGKPQKTRLPPPFSQVPNIALGHQVHHKFVICGFNGADPTVYCGSSNLSVLGEQVNGDNLLTIRDPDIAACFAIEALSLIDHFNFLDSTSTEAAANLGTPPSPNAPPPAVATEAAVAAQWFLGTTDAWVGKYFDDNDLHSRDRKLFVR